MFKKFGFFIMVLSLLFSLPALQGCKKKEEPPPPATPQVQHPPVQPSMLMPKGKPVVVVPDEVKNAWKAVRLQITDKTNNQSQQIVVELGKEHAISGSNLKIKVEEFLPDFKMDGLTITSASNEPKNPAVRVIVYESDKEIFKGWLYSKFPNIHPFTHDRYAITLVEGIKK